MLKSNFRLIAMVQVYNEVVSGNLERCLSSLSRYCDDIVVYDDGSTDDPWGIYARYVCDVITGSTNDFLNELQHKQMLVDRCAERGAEWILRMDADETIEICGEEHLRELCMDANVDSWTFHMVNLWRSTSHYRVDGSWNDVVFNRLWRVPPGGLRFSIEQGLHKTNYPIGATDNEGWAPFEILHYGFASDEEIIRKYHTYKAHGQSGLALDRIIDESTLRLKKSRDSWFGELIDNLPIEEVLRVPIKKKVTHA